MIFDTNNLDTLTIHELGLLLMLYDKSLDNSKTVLEVKDTDISNLLEGLCKKGYIISCIYATDFNQKPPYQHISYSLVQKGKNVLADNCVQDKTVNKLLSKRIVEQRCNALAPKLMELFPIGTKPGTSLKWRGNTPAVSEKLQKIILSGNDFTDEEAIAATKSYVDSFNGIYTTMRILPYFISKNIIKGGELEKTRDFLSYIEDLRNNPQQKAVSRDWESELK